MPVAQSSPSRIELAPHVHNARYACPMDELRPEEFHFITGYEECDGLYQVKHHAYPYLILEMIVKGSGSLVLNDQRYELAPGSCFCGGPSIDYQIRSSRHDKLVKYFIAFGASHDRAASPSNFLFPGFTNFHADTEDITKWCELILFEGTAKSKNPVENTADLISILIRKIAPDTSIPHRQPTSDALVNRALKEIDSNFRTLRSLQDIADALNVSSEHLCRVFKASNKASPYRILSRRKLEHAYAQLKMTQIPIQEIAQSLNYSDPFHFSRAFKARYGAPPSALR